MSSKKPKPVDARARLARRIRILRIERRWSQEVLGELSGLHRSYIGSVERAERNISLNNIEKIANALNVPLHDLLCTPVDRCIPDVAERTETEAPNALNK